MPILADHVPSYRTQVLVELLMSDSRVPSDDSRSKGGMRASSRRQWLFDMFLGATRRHIQNLFPADARKFHSAHSKVYQPGCCPSNQNFSLIASTTSIDPQDSSIHNSDTITTSSSIHNNRIISYSTISEVALDGYSICQCDGAEPKLEEPSPTVWHRHPSDPCSPCSLLGL